MWLRNGIAGDDTHGHVDDLARFTDPHTVVIAVEEDPREANYAPLQENLALLRTMQDQDGRPLKVATVPMPQPVYFDGQRLPASYANFYIANHLVLVPTFNDANDRIALNQLAATLSATPSHRHRGHRFGTRAGHTALHDAAAARLRALSASRSRRLCPPLDLALPLDLSWPVLARLKAACTKKRARNQRKVGERGNTGSR